MFLVYRAKGKRCYGKTPLKPYLRKAWAFQFLIKGSCSLTFPDKGTVQEVRLVAPMLLVTGPDFLHGYNGRAEESCSVVVFHFDEADYCLKFFIGQGGYRCIPLSQDDLSICDDLYKRCGQTQHSPGFTTSEDRKKAGLIAPLVYGIASMELTLFFLQHLPPSELRTTPDPGMKKVTEALAWYEANLMHRPNVTEVAHAVHLSTTHLRRLFHKFQGTSPQNAFAQLRFERAKWLMRDLTLSLEQVADASGFSSGSDFSHAFKCEFGSSPKGYRDHLKNVSD